MGSFEPTEPAMAPIDFQLFDPLLSDAEADGMLRLCERFGRYGTYSEESIEDDFAGELAQRYDAAFNFVQTGGRLGRKDSIAKLAARTNYFRETYAYDAPLVPGIEPFLHHAGFREAARRLYGREIVRPAIVYANLLVPGQELAIHTDVPEFRGVNRKRDPQWLIVAMHHSRLFERWRMPIATGVAWFGNPEGGEFAFYPEGPWGAPVAHRRAPQHGDPARYRFGLPRRRPGRGIARADAGSEARDAARASTATTAGASGTATKSLARYAFRDLRFSISWKAYCFADAAEEALVREHRDDLSRAAALAALVADLRRRGRIAGAAPPDADLARLIIREYIQFPPPAPALDPGARATA